MAIKARLLHIIYLLLFLCVCQGAVSELKAQEPASGSDTIPLPKARQRRMQAETSPIVFDSLSNDSLIVIDSLAISNQENIDRLNSSATPEVEATLAADSIYIPVAENAWTPNPTKATWLAVVFPGGGQIYNRKYWKLPIIYGGFAGCAYALSWNNNMYKDYSKAFLDIMDDNPNTNSYLELLPPNYQYDEEYLKELLRKRKDMYRRYRDISIFAFIGVYLISIIDAYVDAELSNFDISPDLSLRIEPTIINDKHRNGNSIGLQCSFRF